MTPVSTKDSPPEHSVPTVDSPESSTSEGNGPSTGASWKGALWKGGWWKIVLASLGIAICGIAVLGFVGVAWLGVGSISATEPRPVRDIPAVNGAPEASLVMSASPVGEVGFVVDELFVDDREVRANDGWAVVADSARHVSDIETPFDLVSMYSWDEVVNDTTNTTSSCIGGLGEFTSFTACAPTPSRVTQISTGGTEDAGTVTLDVLAFNLPKNAAWLVATTDSGTRIAGAVVEGSAYLAWPGEGPIAAEDNMRPVKVQALDANFGEVYQTSIG